MPLFRQIVLEKELEERLRWLIRLRWFAVAGVMLAILSTRIVLDIGIRLKPLLLGNAVLLIYNILCLFVLRRIHAGRSGSDWFGKATRLGNLQITVDLLLLAYLLHFSGGVENPFILFFIFHMVIAGILLSNLAAFLQAAWAVILLWLLFWVESTDILPHLHLSGFLPDAFCLYHTRFLPGLLGVFTVTLFLVVYMTTSIVNRMRDGEHELAITNQKLAKKDRIKSEYVLKVSHDIQSHLSAIQSCLDVVLQGLTGPVAGKSREMIERAEKRSRFVIRFVKDLLDLSKMRAMDKLSREDLPLKEQVFLITEQFRESVENKRLRIRAEISDLTVVHMNRNTLMELFINLIGNAVRYTPDNGRIDIREEQSEQEGFIQISVEDNGIGIPEEALPHLFEDFYRAKNAREHDKNGTGLGLAIVKQIVEAHGGAIRVESRQGKGSRFILTLPEP